MSLCLITIFTGLPSSLRTDSIFRGGGGGGGLAEIFLGWGDGRIYKHTFVNMRVGADHIWPAPLGNLCYFFFHFYLVF